MTSSGPEGFEPAPGGGATVAARPALWDGRYRVVRTLGEGGMGRVVLAHDLARGERPVAIKILLPAYLDTISEFLHEYVLHRGLSHPNIPRAYELGFANQPDATYPYFAMEYCRGVPLLSVARRKLGPRFIFEVATGILRALDHIHRKGLVHGDLKPGNVLVTDAGDEAIAHLIDLGVASPVGGYTDADVFVGTPEYAAPELLVGVGVDERADLYAVGLILYELFALRRPWLGSDETALLIARRAGAPPPIESPGCSQALEDLIARTLDPVPSRRVGSAAELLAALGEAMGFDAEIEPPSAFARRLRVLPHPGEGLVRHASAPLIAGLREGDEDAFDRGLVLSGLPSLDGRTLATSLADRAAQLGARVLRVALPVPVHEPLAALHGELTVLLRLYPELADTYRAAPTALAAAHVLVASGRPVVVTVDGLERADEESLRALRVALRRPSAHVRIIATVHPDDPAVAPDALRSLVDEPGVRVVDLAPLSLDALGAWLDQAVGPAALRPQERDALLQEARGTPAGLIAALHDAYRRGRIVRTARGYAPGQRPVTAPPTAPPLAERAAAISDLDALLACVREPLPERTLTRYLGSEAPAIPQLLRRRLVAHAEDGGLVHGDEARRASVYGELPTRRRRRLHRRLAVALEEGRSRDHQRVAREYGRSDTPLLAVPHLVAAARAAPGEGRPRLARELIDDAERLLRAHQDEQDTIDTWRFWSLVWRADAFVAMATGDLDRFEAVVEKLFTLGTDMAHRQTLRVALEHRLLVDERRRDYARLIEDAGALLSLEPSGPSADGLARLRWAKALRYRADGLPAQAAEQLERALGDGPHGLSVELQLTLLRARATLFVDVQWHAQAEVAVTAFLDAATDAARGEELIRARGLRATLRRHRGEPAAALADVRYLLRDIEGERIPGVDGAIAWELAACHLEFGWFASARDHARQTQTIALDDRDESLLVRALLIEATALAHLGEPEQAWRLVQEASRRVPEGDASVAVNVRLHALELVSHTVGFAQLEGIAREASELGWRCQRRLEGARAARAFAIAARAAIGRRDPVLAVQFATLAVGATARHAPEHIRRSRHFALLAEALVLARRPDDALAMRRRARADLARIAEGIADESLRAAWLAHPANLAVTADT